MSVPLDFVRFVIHGTNKSDWLAASPALFMLFIMVVLILISLSGAGSSWLDSAFEYISWWPVWEIIALIFTPVILWWFDADSRWPVKTRVILSVAVFTAWYALTWKTHLVMLAYIGIFFGFRVLPVFFLPRPGKSDVQRELIKLLFAVLFALFVLGPVYMVFDMISQRTGFHWEQRPESVFLAFSAMYFLFLACLELLFNDYEDAL